jgi:hypothetical protein
MTTTDTIWIKSGMLFLVANSNSIPEPLRGVGSIISTLGFMYALYLTIKSK